MTRDCSISIAGLGPVFLLHRDGHGLIAAGAGRVVVWSPVCSSCSLIATPMVTCSVRGCGGGDKTESGAGAYSPQSLGHACPCSYVLSKVLISVTMF